MHFAGAGGHCLEPTQPKDTLCPRAQDAEPGFRAVVAQPFPGQGQAVPTPSSAPSIPVSACSFIRTNLCLF